MIFLLFGATIVTDYFLMFLHTHAIESRVWIRVLPSTSYRKYLIRVSMGMDGGDGPIKRRDPIEHL